MVFRRGLLRLERHFGYSHRVFQRLAQQSWPETVAGAENRVQSYLSNSSNPYLNLSIENYFLQKAPSDSVVLFLYTNGPCIVIGRNQNPWLEVNLDLLNAAKNGRSLGTEPPAIGHVDLVRRRSGGGAVFHDEGNVNWSVISPSADFYRDKHAEMVVRALRAQGVDRARINDRHDIVLDQGQFSSSKPVDGSDRKDTHVTPYSGGDPILQRPLKISGSAYKLTRTRALHHGTCLLSSPNLHIIPDYLHSPAKPFITAKGVESVSSPVSNVGITNENFMKSVQDEFSKMYESGGSRADPIVVGEEMMDVPEVRAGVEELQREEWMYSQTPQFTFSNVPTDDQGGDQQMKNSQSQSPSTKITMSARHGQITEFNLKDEEDVLEVDLVKQIQEKVVGRNLHEIGDWKLLLTGKDTIDSRIALDDVVKWLNSMFPVNSKLKR